MRLQVDNQRICVRHRRGQVVIELGIVHQQAQTTLSAVQLVGKLLRTLQCGIHSVECALHIEASQVCRQSIGIIEHAIRLANHARYLLVETSHQRIQLSGRNGEVVGAVLADDNSDYMLITNQGQLIRSSMSDTPLVSRSAAGNILMRMYEGDSVMAIQSISEDVVQNSKKMAEARQKEREELKAEQEAQNSSPSLETALNEKPDESAPENSTDTQTVDSGDNNSDNQ